MKKGLQFFAALVIVGFTVMAFAEHSKAFPSGPSYAAGKSIEIKSALVQKVHRRRGHRRYWHPYRRGCWVDRWGYWHCMRRERHWHPRGCWFDRRGNLHCRF